MTIRDAILSATVLKRETVPTPEWQPVGITEVVVSEFSGEARDAFEADATIGEGKSAKRNLVNIRARMAALTVIDPATGARIFSDEDAAALGRTSARALDRIWEAAVRLNALTEQAVESATKN